MKDFIALLIGAMIINNVVVTKFVSMSQIKAAGGNFTTASRLGLAAMKVMAVSAILNFFVFKYVLEPLKLQSLDLIAYTLVVVLSILFVSNIIKKMKPEIYESVKASLPLLSVNSAIFYIAIDNAAQGLDLPAALAVSIGAPIGLFFAFAVFSSIMERLDYSENTGAFKGTPALLAAAGLAAMALGGLAGIF